jgi:hypothetical protein
VHQPIEEFDLHNNETDANKQAQLRANEIFNILSAHEESGYVGALGVAQGLSYLNKVPQEERAMVVAALEPLLNGPTVQ